MDLIRKRLPLSQVTMVIFHGSRCSDGMGAAWCIYSRMPTEQQLRVQWYPSNYVNEPPNVAGHSVVIVDFSYPRRKLLEMKAVAKELIVLDHHETTRDQLKGLEFAYFNLDMSGAVLAWRYATDDARRIPKAIQYIQDRDLWRFRMIDSRIINLYICYALPMTMEAYHEFVVGGSKTIERAKEEGTVIQRLVDDSLNTYRPEHEGHAYVTLPRSGMTIRVANVHGCRWISEIGEMLARLPNTGFVALFYWKPKNGCYHVSLRSSGIVHVGKVALTFGYGGNYATAAFDYFVPDINSIFCAFDVHIPNIEMFSAL